MRLFAAADLHGKCERLDRMRRKVDELRPDAVVLAGDLTGWTPPKRTRDALEGLPAPVLTVFGNADPPWARRILSKAPGVIPLDMSEASVCGEHLVGVSGTVPLPFSSRLRWFGERRAASELASLVRRETVLVAHPPPWGVLDTVFGRWHAGCASLAEAVRSARPALLLCGHVHEAAGAATLGPTVVVNCSVGAGGEGALIEFEGGRVLSMQRLGEVR